jgi:hypothetical protein
MILYFSMFACFMPLFTLGRPISQEVKSLFIFLSWLWLVFLIGFRFEVGYDWKPYLVHYEITRNSTLQYAIFSTDVAYGLINWIASNNNLGIQFVNVICAGAGLFPICLLASRLKQPSLFLMSLVPIYLIVIGMGSTRQFVAIGYVFLAADYMYKAELKKFLLSCLVAALFHKTALVFFPAYFIFQLQGLSRYVLAFSLLGFGGIFSSVIVDSLNFSYYIDNQLASSGALFRALFILPPALAMLSLGRESFSCDIERFVLRSVSILAIGYVPVSIVGLVFVDRMMLYLIPFISLGYVKFLGSFNTRLNRTLYFVFCSLYFLAAFALWYEFANSSDAWKPYLSIIFE